VTSDGGAEVTARGVCWGISHNPTTISNETNDGTGTGAFTSNLAGLTANTTYYVRAYATNSQGTSYGNEVSFSTSQVTLATLTTTAITSITSTTAVSGGNITADGGGTITSRGVCWNTDSNPTTANNITTDGTGSGSFTSNLIGLNAATSYYVRAYATNSAGTAYGNQQSFTTSQEIGQIIFNPNLTYGTVIDIEGNVYKTIQIGSKSIQSTQVWMAENLKTTSYNDGTSIPNVTDNAIWGGLSTGAYCWYNNDAATYKNIYGALYNWYTVNTAKLCPAGWHVPNDSEWTTLITYLGGYSVAGGKLKETGTTHWLSPNTGATNESGFTALPSGRRNYNTGSFELIGSFGLWWTSSAEDATRAYSRWVFYNDGSSGVDGDYNQYGYPIRCVRD
jgi:uncharacterized protein (TIGR02145 family)